MIYDVLVEEAVGAVLWK